MFEISNTITIVIPDGPYKDAEITANGDIPLSLVFDIDAALSAVDEAKTSRGKLLAIKGAVDAFANNILDSWNLARHGVAVPATAEEMMKLPAPLVIAVLTAWGETMKGTPAPLVEQSVNGKPSEEQPDPMEA